MRASVRLIATAAALLAVLLALAVAGANPWYGP
jgi:hypothetical protein